METTANMKCRFIKISWGIVRISNVEVYCELWLATGPMNLKIKFKLPKGLSYSYAASAHDCPFKDGAFMSYWIPKNVYFPVHFCGTTVNELTELVVKHLNLKFFSESRKWLTKEEETTLRTERESRSLMEWLNPEMIREIIPTLRDVDDSILWRYVDGSDQWCEWFDDPMNPAMIRKRVLDAYGAYQVYLDMDNYEYHITRWCEDGVQDYPWAIYVGTRSECEAYVRDHE